MSSVKKSTPAWTCFTGRSGAVSHNLLFSVAATAILEQLFNASDIARLSVISPARNGRLAVAAVGANSSIISLIVNLFVGIALGANVAIAHAIGRGDKTSVQKTVHTSIILALAGGLLISTCRAN